MKLLTAIIRPERLEAVQAVLPTEEACLVSVGQVVGYGMEPARESVYRGGTHQVLPVRLRLEIIVDDLYVDEIIEAIAESGATGGAGSLGDGAIFVTALTEWAGIGANNRKVLAASE